MPCAIIIVILLVIGLFSIVTEWFTQNWQLAAGAAGVLIAVMVAWQWVLSEIEERRKARAAEEHRQSMERLEAERRRRNIERFDRMVLSCAKCGGIARAVPLTVSIYSCEKCGHRAQGPDHNIDEIPEREYRPVLPQPPEKPAQKM